MPFDGLDFIHIEKVDTFVQIQKFDKDLGTDDVLSADAQNGGYRADQNIKVVSPTSVSNQGSSFTIAELEDYFNNGSVL